MTNTEGALSGIRVIEAGLLVQGPQAAATLADWGADVLKVELPGFGDQSRWLPISPDDPRSAYFIACNRGKRSVAIDLRKEGGRRAFLRLCDTADAVITNFKPGTMESWGLGYDELSSRNPRLVYAVGSSFGSRGADAAREGADLSAQAAGGLISTTGRPGGEPSPVGATIADHIASQNLVGGVLAALLARNRTGRGQRVESSLLAGQVWAQASEYTRCLLTGSPAGRSNRGHPMVPGLYGIFPTADGWIAIVGVAGKARATFFDVLGVPELGERFSQPLYWEAEKEALFPILDALFSKKTTAEWSDILSDAGLRYSPVRDHREVVADECAWDNGFFLKTDDGDVVASAVHFSDTSAQPGSVPPELGQHTEEVLLEVGYTWDEIASLAGEGAI